MLNLPSLIFALVMGFLMPLSITLATTYARIGLAENFLWAWLGVWVVAYPVAIVCILIYKPLASMLSEKIIRGLARVRKNDGHKDD
jgi:ABC-type thiamin/hydroxymethylpyrimidine transport system permease subunit